MAEQKISVDQVRHVAKFARLALDDAKLQKFAGQLEAILTYVDKIGELDVTGVEPMAHALPLHNVLREDVVEPPLSIEQVLQNAPETDGRFFKVPKIIGGDEDSAGKSPPHADADSPAASLRYAHRRPRCDPREENLIDRADATDARAHRRARTENP